MKLSVTIINAIYIVQNIYTIKVVSADRMIRYIFNNGIAPTAATACTDEDNAKIDSLFGPFIIYNRRGLLDSNETESENNERHLFPLYCRNNCAGYVAKTCRATNCKGFRRHRELTGTDSNVEDDRHLQKDLPCSDHMLLITGGLDTLITENIVSNTCRSYLDKTKRSTSCYDDIIYGEILGIKVWDSGPSPSVIMKDNMPATGYSFCASKQFTMTSINHPCVDLVSFQLTGPNGYNHQVTKNKAPYSLFYDPNGALDGQNVRPGLYTLKVTPDGQSNKTKVFRFNVNNC